MKKRRLWPFKSRRTAQQHRRSRIIGNQWGMGYLRRKVYPIPKRLHDDFGVAMKVYCVLARRWGDIDSHAYVVGVFEKKAMAHKVAKAENEYRGGKYTCEISEWDTRQKFDLLYPRLDVNREAVIRD